MSSNIGNLSSLLVLWYYNTSMTGPLSDSLGELGYLTTLVVANSYFSGHLPQSLQLLGGTLQMLDVSFNHLSGTLPSYLCTPSLMSVLQSLSVFLNFFTGSINCLHPDLVVLLGYSNSFTGSLPSDMINMTFLEQLNLGHNLLTGNIVIPTDVDSLILLDLSSNELSGSLPYNIGEYWKLAELDVSDNGITGTDKHPHTLHR
jgi:hypothetical protein